MIVENFIIDTDCRDVNGWSIQIQLTGGLHVTTGGRVIHTRVVQGSRARMMMMVCCDTLHTASVVVTLSLLLLEHLLHKHNNTCS